MPTIYANDFAGLTSADIAYGNQRQAALQSAMSNLISASSQAQQRRLQEQQMAERRREFGAQMSLEGRKMTTAQYEWQAEQNRKANQDRISREYLDTYKKLTDRQMSAPTPSEDKALQLGLQVADHAAEIGDADAINNLGIPEPLKNVYRERALQNQEALRAQHEQAQGVANLANRRDLLGSYIASSKQAAADATHVFGNDTATDASGKKYKIPDYENQRVKDWSDELEQLNPRVTKLLAQYQDKLGWVGPHPDTGEYTVTLPRYRWMQSPQDQQQPQAQAAPPPQVTPTTSLSNTNAPPPAFINAKPAKVRIRRSDGQVGTIPSDALSRARALDPNLQVLAE